MYELAEFVVTWGGVNIRSALLELMDQLHITQECNQQGDNCNDVITDGGLIDWQQGVAPNALAALNASCRMLPFRWIG